MANFNYDSNTLLEQVAFKLSDKYNTPLEEVVLETRLIDDLNMNIIDIYQFRDKIEDELGLVPKSDDMVKFWRTVQDIINSYIP